MSMYRRRLYCLSYLTAVFTLFSTSSVFAQKIENIRLTQQGDKIIVSYDFIATAGDNSYEVKIFNSVDGYRQPLVLVKGDIGAEVRPGNNKEIIWFAREEIGAYKGEIIVEIRVFLLPENIYLTQPGAGSKLKRGSALNIGWTGGSNEDRVSILLMKGGGQVETIANNIDNSGSYSWISPSKLKPGSDYKIQITGSSNRGIHATSSDFTIKRKVPLWLLIAPVAVVGATVAILLSGDDTGGGNNNLPGAPDPN